MIPLIIINVFLISTDTPTFKPDLSTSIALALLKSIANIVIQWMFDYITRIQDIEVRSKISETVSDLISELVFNGAGALLIVRI